MALYISDRGGTLQMLGCRLANLLTIPTLFLHVPVSSAVQLVERLLETSFALNAWLSSNNLRLNPAKTQRNWVGGRLASAFKD